MAQRYDKQASNANKTHVFSSAQEELEVAQDEQWRMPGSRALNHAEIDAMLDSLSEVSGILDRAKPTELQQLYTELRLEMVYQPENRAVTVSVAPGRGSAGVRRGNRTVNTPETPWYLDAA